MIISVFPLVRTAFFLVYNENSPDNYKSLKISIETIMKKTEKLKFVPDHLHKNAVTSSQQTLNLVSTMTQDCC